MDIEEARALKAKVLKDVVTPLVDSHIKAASMSFAAPAEMTNATSAQPKRAMAIGIAKVKKGYRLPDGHSSFLNVYPCGAGVATRKPTRSRYAACGPTGAPAQETALRKSRLTITD